MAVSFNCPWVLRACRQEREASTPPYPYPPCARPRNHPSTDGRELREFAMIPLAVGARKHTGGIRVIGLRAASCSTGYYLGLMLFPKMLWIFSFPFFFFSTLCNSRRVTLFFLFFFFDFCFNLSSFGIVLFFLYLVFVIRE